MNLFSLKFGFLVPVINTHLFLLHIPGSSQANGQVPQAITCTTTNSSETGKPPEILQVKIKVNIIERPALLDQAVL